MKFFIFQGVMWTFIIVGGSNLDFLQKNNLYKYFPTGCHPFLNQSLLETPKWEVKPTGNPTLGGLEKFLCAWAGLHTRVLVGLFAVAPILSIFHKIFFLIF